MELGCNTCNNYTCECWGGSTENINTSSTDSDSNLYSCFYYKNRFPINQVELYNIAVKCNPKKEKKYTIKDSIYNKRMK
jgi:hypothetical protein